jgi:hypothetical protein
MAKLLLIVCALIAGGVVVAQAETTPTQTPAASNQPPVAPDTQSPPARLIKPRPGHSETHPTAERARHPVDDRCKPLKEQLETALQKPGNQHRVFQAKLAHNAGTRFCREGSADKGIAEFQRGLSYLQETPH